MPKTSKTENSGIHSREDIDDNSVPSLKFNPFLDIELKPFEIFSNTSLANEMPPKIIPVDEICNNLRIPDIVTQIKPFEGDSRTLSNFVSEVDRILELINSQADPAYVRLILGKIRNKIIGEADRVLNLYRTPLDWPAIKTNLISHYADKRNEEALMSTLYTLFQDDKTVEQFYSEIIDIYTILSENLRTNITNDLIIEEIIISYNNSIHSSTKYTPYELFFGKPYNVKIPFDSEHTYLQDLEKARKEVYKHVVTLEINKKTNRINKLNSNR